jgi:hypothetical protein
MLSILVAGTAVVVAFGVVGGMANNSRFWVSNFNPNKKKIQDDLRTMKALMEPKLETIIPWTEEEKSLLSAEQIDVKKKKKGTTVIEGTFISIYHEPMVTYIYKKYLNKKYEDAIIYARTSNRAFEYRVKKNDIAIRINNHDIGILKNDNKLYRKNKVIASIGQNSQTNLTPILLHDKKGQIKELGHIVKKPSSDEVNKRALQLIDQQMNSNEEAIFLALVLLKMIHSSITR